MSESDQSTSVEAGAPAPPPAQPVLPPDQTAYAAPAKPRFLDQVLGMRAVIAVALATLVIGGLSGFLLGEHTGGHDRFGRGGPGGFRQGFQGPPGMSHQWGGQQGQQWGGQQGQQWGGQSGQQPNQGGPSQNGPSQGGPSQGGPSQNNKG